MPPTQLVPGAPITPAPVNTNNLGVATPTPAAAPVPTQLPSAQAPPTAPTPASVGSNQPPGILSSIANLYQIPGQTALATNAGQSAGNVAGTQFAAQKAQNDIKIQNEQNSLDPSKYTITKNNDGTINITNSLGDQVNLATYVNLTGANPAEVLQNAGATDQADQKFVAAYNNLQTYIQAKIAAQNGDETAKAQVNDFNQQNPGLANMELGQLQQAFMSQYGSYFGQPPGNQNALQQAGVNSTIASANNPKSTSAYYGGFPTPTPISASASTVNAPSSADILSGLTIAPGQ